MVKLLFSFFVFISLLSTYLVYAAPDGVSFQRRDTIVEPRFVLYSKGVPSTMDAVEGYNVVVLSSLSLEGVSGGAATWMNMTTAQRSTIKNEYNAAGIRLLISLFGDTDAPTSSGVDPVDTANTMAAWAIEYELDGVDVNYKDFKAFEVGTAESWLTTFTQQLRMHIPQGESLVTLTALAVWGKEDVASGGGLVVVDNNAGDKIDWYNVQFNNPGTEEYTTCPSLLINSTGTWPKTAVFQMAGNGVPLDKIVIGKPLEMTGNTSTGYMAPDTLASCLMQAKKRGWNAGIMGYPVEDTEAGTTTSWLKIVKSKAFP